MTSKSSMKSKGKAGKVSAAPIHGLKTLGHKAVSGLKNVQASSPKKVVSKIAGGVAGAPKVGNGSKATPITGSKSPSLKKAISPKPFGGKKSKKAK